MNDLSLRLKEISCVKDYNLFPTFPTKNLLIEVTNACNCNCIFCANRKMQRKRRFIDEKFAFKVLRDAYELGTREVGFYTTGEPLLNPNLPYFIKEAKSIGYNYVYITTNGILLNDKFTLLLVNSGVDSIKFSINAINDEDYKFIHGVDCYNVVINNLKKLYNFRKDNNLHFKIFVSYIATKFTDYGVELIKDYFKDYCDEVAIINVRNQSGMMPEVNSLLSCKKNDDKVQAERLVPCHYVFDTVNVSCEGYLTACCADFENYLAYADLNVVSLKEAWHNQIITNLRMKHLNNNLCGTLCDNCIYSLKNVPEPLSSDLITSKITQQVFSDESVYKRILKK